jgi:hypothetical protein
MSEPTPSKETKTKTANLIRLILIWAVLGRVQFTCVMAASRKFS